MVSVHAPTEDKEQVKEEFKQSLKKLWYRIPNYDMKVILGGFNAKVGNKSFTYPACGMHGLYAIMNLNGKKLWILDWKKYGSYWNLVWT